MKFTYDTTKNERNPNASIYIIATAKDYAGNSGSYRSEEIKINNNITTRGLAIMSLNGVENAKVEVFSNPADQSNAVLLGVGETKDHGYFEIKNVKPYKGDIRIKISNNDNGNSNYDDEVHNRTITFDTSH